MQARGAQAAEFFSSIKTEALGLVAVLTGTAGLTMLARGAAHELAGIGQAAANIGISVPNLVAFQNAVKANNGSAEAAAQSFLNLTNAAERLKVLGEPGMTPALGQIGAIPGVDDALAIAKKFAAFADANKKDIPFVNLIGQRIGLDQGTINELRRGVAQFSADMADALGRTPTKAMTAEALELNRSFERITDSIKMVGFTLLDDLSPKIRQYLDLATLWIDKNKLITAGLLAVGGAGASVGAAYLLRAAFRFLGIGGGAAAAAEGAGAGAAAVGGGGLAAAVASVAGGLLRVGGPVAAFLYALGITNKAGAGEDEELRRWRARGAPIGGSDGRPAPEPTWLDRLATWWHGLPSIGADPHAQGAAGGGSSGGGGIRPPARGTAAYGVMEETRAFWKSKGLSDEAVSGILANIAAESSFNPTLPGDNGTSYGLYQHHATRKDALFAKYGPNPTVAQQNEFAWSEVAANPRLLDALTRARTSGSSASAWTFGFENPKDAAMRATERAGAAPFFNSPAELRGGATGAALQSRNGGGAPSFTIGSIVINNPSDSDEVASNVGAKLRRLASVQMANTGLA